MCLLTLTLCASHDRSKNIRTDHCGDWPFTKCCDKDFSCTSSASLCTYDGNVTIGDSTSYCEVEQCPCTCCINEKCGSVQQCSVADCQAELCFSGCCNGKFCGSDSICEKQSSLATYVMIGCRCPLILSA